MLKGQNRWGAGRECYFLKLKEGRLDEVMFAQKHKGNGLGRNLGKEYFRERAE